jgi:hypothetical protein
VRRFRSLDRVAVVGRLSRGGSLEDQIEVLAPSCALVLGRVPPTLDAVGAHAGHEALVKVRILPVQRPVIPREAHVEQP